MPTAAKIYLMKRLCHGKRLMLFSLKPKEMASNMPWLWLSAKGKAGEKGRIFHRAVGMEQPHALIGA